MSTLYFDQSSKRVSCPDPFPQTKTTDVDIVDFRGVIASPGAHRSRSEVKIRTRRGS